MPARPATRERKERFINSFGRGQGIEQVAECLRRYGLSWLTEEQLSEITADLAQAAVESTRRVVRNRSILRGAA